MERKASTLILSGLLLASFFVPAIQWEDFTMSGFDFVISDHTPGIKNILLVVPCCALCLLVSALIDATSIMRNKFLLRAPLIALFLLFILVFTNTEYRAAMGGIGFIKNFSLGFWAMLSISLMLAGLRKKRVNHVYKLAENSEAEAKGLMNVI